MKRLGLALLLSAHLAAGNVAAQEPAREQQFVYGLNVTTGAEYRASFVPAAIDTIYLLAERDNVIDPKQTEVYFWPLENAYRPDFAAMNQLVEGQLEVTQGNRVVRTIDLTEYVVQFDQAGDAAGGALLLGPAARAGWERFQTARTAYLERLRLYSDAFEAHQREIEGLRARAAAGLAVQPPVAPVQPAPFTLFSTEVARGFPMNLPAGTYAIRLRDRAGAIVAGSAKRLIAIAPRRVGVAYEVVPAERWTRPERASDPGDAIYTAPGSVLYLRPYGALELNALEHARLRNPQDLDATANRWTWIHVAPIADARLAFQEAGAERRLPLEGFAVEQLPGAALGYRVIPFERRPDDPPAGALGERRPDLIAHRIAMPEARSAATIRLIDREGREVPGSARQLAVAGGAPDWLLGLPIAIVLTVGTTIVLWRRDRAQSLRALPPDRRQLVA